MKNILILFASVALFSAVNAQSWYQVQTGTTKQINTIDFPSSTVGYIGGNDSLLLKSVDGGLSWSPISYSGVTFSSGGEHIIQLEFLTDDIGYMTVGPYSGVYKTINGGSTWQQVNVTGNLCYTRALYFTSEDNGFIGGSGCFQGELINRMTAGTCTETTVPLTFNTDFQVSTFDFRGNIGLASSLAGRFLRTTDGGNNWDTIPSSIPFTDSIAIHAIKMIDDTLCYAVYSVTGGNNGFGILRSVDAGLSWDFDPNTLTFYYPEMFDLTYSGNGKLFFVGKPGWDTTGVVFSIGQDNILLMDAVDEELYASSTYGDSVVFAGGKNGYLITNVPLNLLGFVNQKENMLEWSLFPNPAKSQIHIKGFENKAVQFQVNDLAGKLLLNGNLNGDELDVSTLNGGMYVLRIESEQQLYSKRFIKQ